MADLHVAVVTPDGVRFDGTVDSCTAPGYEGEFQVLAGHADLIAELKIGAIRLGEKGENRLLATSGGFIEVSKNNVNIIAETAEFAENIEIDRARQAEERARRRLQEQKDTDILRAEMALARALNRIKVASRL